MYHFFRIFAVTVVVVIAFISFKKKPEATPPDLPITYANISGIWELKTWKGTSLPKDSWCYIEFSRGDHTFVMHQNLDSMYDRVLTGTYTITRDEYENYIIKGTYDWGKGAWANSYYVTDMVYDGSSMKWTSTNDDSDVIIYARIEEMPKFE